MDKRNKRLSEFEEWIQIFTAYHNQLKQANIVFVDHAAKILNSMYWRYVEYYIRPIISSKAATESPESRISRFKIISATELSIIDVQPIIDSGVKEEEIGLRRLNAEFAYFVAFQILLTFSEEKISDTTIDFISNYKEHIPEVDTTEILTVLEEHLQWLTHLDPGVNLPIISNSQTWRFFYLALLAVEGKLPQTPTN